MTHRESIALIDNPLLHQTKENPRRWADLGCGDGVFTLALAHYLAQGSTIEAIDRNPGIAKQVTKNGVTITPHTADITQPNSALSNLDGLIIANAIHYVQNKPAFLQLLHSALKPAGIITIIEYDTDTPIPRWVPYPLSFSAATRLFTPPHWSSLQKGHTRPSAFGRSNLYCAFATAS